MQGKYKIVILLLFISLHLFSQDKTKNLTFIFNDEKVFSTKLSHAIKHLINLGEDELLKNNDNIVFSNIKGEVDNGSLKKIVSYIFSHNVSAFYYITAIEEDNTVDIDIKLYNSIGSVLFEDKLIIENNFDHVKYVSKNIELKWNEIINNSLQNINITAEKRLFNKKFIRRSFSFEHDYPYFSLGVTALSVKLYFDERIYENINTKVFSVFPIDVRIAFFPLKYFEVGIFGTFNFDNMVYTYYDRQLAEYKNFYPNFAFLYGFFAGLSFFQDNNHYSIGLKFSNLFYNLATTPTWRKTWHVDSYFLPQFSIYQRIDFKIFKIVYFSISFDFYTLPLFELNNKYFYSEPFRYNFFGLQVSFVGISIII